jgi:flagellar biosynthetic protein FliR
VAFIDINTIIIFIMATCRTSGCIFFNPIFGRTSVPSVIKVGLSMALGLYIVVLMQGRGTYMEDYTTLAFALSMAKEFAIGFTLGYVMRVFLAIFTLSGYVIDMQAGYSMATLYDASSNAQVSITGNLTTIMFTLLFFVTNSHANLAALVVKTYDVIPLGLVGINREVGLFAIQMFGLMLIYAFQLTIPFIVLEIFTEVAVGMMMKMVPNINVFVVNIHLKMLVGLILLLTIIPALGVFMTKLNTIMFERMTESLTYLIL